jgi:hypothetical protein
MGIYRNADPQLLRNQYRRMLTPGTVLLFEGVMLSGKPKLKRWVVIGEDGAHVHLFIINTRPALLVQSTPHMLNCQAFMAQALHPFMTHDSHIDCYRPWRYAIDDVLQELLKQALGNGTNPVLGKITLPTRDDVVSRLLQSRVTSPQEKSEFAAYLRTMT